MKGCTYGATLEELLNRPMGALALHGRDGEDDGAKPGDDAESEEDEKSNNDEEEGKDGAGKNKGGETETVATLSRKLTNSEEARNRNADKRREAETALAEANKKIGKMEKDGTPDDAIKTQNDELTASNAKLLASNQNLMIQIALRDDKGHDWQDPDAVLRLADLSEVEFDEKTSKAVGLKAALDKLAKEKPYLLKLKEESKDEEQDNPNGGRGTGRRPAPRNTGKPSDAAAETARLKAKYPALRRG